MIHLASLPGRPLPDGYLKPAYWSLGNSAPGSWSRCASTCSSRVPYHAHIRHSNTDNKRPAIQLPPAQTRPASTCFATLRQADTTFSVSISGNSGIISSGTENGHRRRDLFVQRQNLGAVILAIRAAIHMSRIHPRIPDLLSAPLCSQLQFIIFLIWLMSSPHQPPLPLASTGPGAGASVPRLV